LQYYFEVIISQLLHSIIFYRELAVRLRPSEVEFLYLTTIGLISSMKRLLKIILGCAILGYISIDIYIYFAYSTKYSKEKLVYIIRSVSISQDSIPRNIIAAYARKHKKVLQRKVYPDLVWCLLRRNKGTYPQIKLAYEIAHCGGILKLSLANQIDNQLSQEQCIYAVLSRCGFPPALKGIDQAAKFYYHKNISALNEQECDELIMKLFKTRN
jgi:hypothetical protein